MQALQAQPEEDLRRRGRAIAECSTGWLVAVNHDDPASSRPVIANHCHQRLCPHCAAVRAWKWQERTAPLLEEVRRAGRVPKFVVLTQRTRPGEALRDARRRLEAAFRKLYRHAEFRRRVTGWLASREVTWSNDAWHYHLNLILDADYWPQEDLSRLWLEITGDSSNVWISAAREQTEREVIKYALKVLELPPAKLGEVVTALHGVRLISTGGAWRGRVKDAELEPDDEAPKGWKVYDLATLRARAASGEAWAHLAIAGCLRWMEQRGGSASLGWLTASLLKPEDAWSILPDAASLAPRLLPKMVASYREAIGA